MPQIKLGLPQDVEIVPNLKMLFLTKVKGLPSPLLLKITYLNNKRLTVATTLSESDAKDIVYSDKAKQKGAQGAKKTGSSVNMYQDPTKIVITTQGVQQQPKLKPTEYKNSDIKSLLSDENGMRQKGSRAPSYSKDGGDKPMTGKGKTFSENNMYFIFSSQMQITIRVEL